MYSKTWEKAGELLRKSRLSTLDSNEADGASWNEAFDLTLLAISEEREADPDFAKELSQLDEETEYKYDLLECLQAYFDHLEALGKWEEVIYSCNRMLENFAWEEKAPSEFMFRKGNALEKLERFGEAEAFGKKWLEKYPDDLYAAASNAFLLMEMGRLDEAKELTEKYISDSLTCDSASDTLFMAAYQLYEITNDINAKQRVEKKIAEYNELLKR